MSTSSLQIANAVRVMIHPASTKHILLGHPWITEDSYTKRFPPSAFFLKTFDDKTKKEIGLFIHDPEHRHVKARLWSLNAQIKEQDFFTDLANRIENSMQKRANSTYGKERENFYLVNGESDHLPGLLVLLLKDQIIIQYYALFWKKIEAQLILILKEKFAQCFEQKNLDDLWVQERNFNQKKSIRSLSGKEQIEFQLQEFGIKYHIRINHHYDLGLYTDMSAIRKQLIPYLEKSSSLLNLYCYTGAFSLFGLSLGLKRVVSVDLSEKYLQWLEENISLNNHFSIEDHECQNMTSEKALLKLSQEKQLFDCVICDPPSASSDGESTTNALKSYERLLPLLLEVTAKDGKLIVFLNTHAISWNKFEEKLKHIISATRFRDKVVVGKRFKLSEDCTPLKGFHEGDYLKGFLIEFKNHVKD